MILLTGASGLLGAHVLERGLARGRSFRAVARAISRRSFLATEPAGVEIVSLDLAGDIAPSTDLFRGVDTVIHGAALASPFAADEAKMMRLNVEATRELFGLAAAAGVRTWVQISSVATLSGGATGLVTEDGEHPRDTPYARTKWLADRALADIRSPMAVLTVHPTFMLGPWDARPSSGGLLLAIRMGRLRHYVERTKNVVAASDVAEGIFRALDAGAAGHYLLGGQDLSIGSFLGDVCRRLNMDEKSLLRLPDVPPEPTRELEETELSILREFCSPSPTSSAKAARDFGYAAGKDPSSLLNDTFSYFAKEKILLPKRPRRDGENA